MILRKNYSHLLAKKLRVLVHGGRGRRIQSEDLAGQYPEFLLENPELYGLQGADNTKQTDLSRDIL